MGDTTNRKQKGATMAKFTTDKERATALAPPPVPGSTEWSGLVTASKIAAIVGCSPYDSPRSMWHRMRGDIPPDPPQPWHQRGHLLEAAVLAWWRTQHPDATWCTDQPWYPLGDWAGATPDQSWMCDGTGRACVVDAKTAADPTQWGTPGTDEVPLHYVVSSQWQMLCADVDVCYLPVLTGGLRFVEYVIGRDQAVGEWLLTEASAFHASLLDGSPPPLDGSVATLSVMRRFHPGIDPDGVVTVTVEDATELHTAKAALAEAEAAYRAATARVLDQAGTARRITTEDGTPVARRQPGPRGTIALHLERDHT